MWSASGFLAVVLVLGLDLSPAPDAEKLLTDGHAAFARGDYAAAAALYERAEVISTDPARVAFYLAGAKYRLALRTEGPSPELHEAERLYRCCLDPSDPRRPQALYGLGNCLLRKAGTRDLAALRAALACYDQCLESAGDDTELLADARYNREKVRLMLLQVQPPPPGSQGDKPPSDDANPQPPRPDPRQQSPGQIVEPGSEMGGDPRAIAGAAKPEPGTNAAKTDALPPPGEGNLDPIPDEVDARPLSPHEAARHLQVAADMLRRERQTHHRRGERASAAGVKDW